MIVRPKLLFPPAPPFLITAGLLMWGWQCEFLIYALLMALSLESARWIQGRVPITEKEFNLIADLSSVIFVVAVVYIFSTRSYHGIFIILGLLPFFFYPLILAQTWSVQGHITPGVLFMSLRRLERNGMSPVNMEIDLSYPYLFASMIAASAGNHHEIIFYICVVVLLAWTLWTLRPKHSHPAVWLLMFTLAGAGGLAGQAGMEKLQAMAEASVLQWFDQFMWRSRDPLRASTAIGSLGKLKLSDRIVARITPLEKPLQKPLLLRESSYTNYAYSVWTNYQNTLSIIDATRTNFWIIDDTINPDDKLRISFFMDNETAIVPIPLGLANLSYVTAAQVEHSAYGALSIELNPGWIKYDTAFNQQQIQDAPPSKEDMEIPSIYAAELKQLADELGLPAQTPQERINTVKKFFADNFTYSVTQNQRYTRAGYLTKFLFEDRKGHCEYFATATALLLRAANVPTRYVVGYAVDEYSTLEQQYIARARHAHSWVQVYADSQWQTLDTTPAVWAPMEAEDQSALEPLLDLWSWAAYKLATWDSEDTENGTTILIWLLLPFLAYYIWRVFIRGRMQRGTKDKQKGNVIPVKQAGLDSIFYALVQELEQRYTPRLPGETLMTWLAKIEKNFTNSELRELLALHYRYRFDPLGLSEAEKRFFYNKANALLTIIL